MCLRKLDIVKLRLTTETTLIWFSPYIPLYDLKSFVFFYGTIVIKTKTKTKTKFYFPKVLQM